MCIGDLFTFCHDLVNRLDDGVIFSWLCAYDSSLTSDGEDEGLLGLIKMDYDEIATR